MPTNEIVKNTQEAASPFVVFQMPVSEIRDAVAANLGGNGMSTTDFERIKIPAGGGTAWTLQSLDGEEMANFLRARRLIIVGVGEGPRDLLVDYEP